MLYVLSVVYSQGLLANGASSKFLARPPSSSSVAGFLPMCVLISWSMHSLLSVKSCTQGDWYVFFMGSYVVLWISSLMICRLLRSVVQSCEKLISFCVIIHYLIPKREGEISALYKDIHKKTYLCRRNVWQSIALCLFCRTP